MPTNRLWLEHTERAAWDSVNTLRQQLERLEERTQRLSPVGESWREICEELDETKKLLGLSQHRYAEIMRAIKDHVLHLRQQSEEQQTRIAELSREVERFRVRAQTVEVVHVATPRVPQEGEGIADMIRSFCRYIEQKQQRDETRAAAPLNRERLFSALEMRCEELEVAPRHEVMQSAAEVAYLALKIAGASNLAAGQSGNHDTAFDHDDDDDDESYEDDELEA